MKKVTTVLLILVMAVFVISCGGNSDNQEPAESIDTTETTSDNHATEEVVTEKPATEIKEEVVEETSSTQKETSVDNKTIVFETNHGNFEITVWIGKAPIAAGNLAEKATDGFFDGLTFHRIVNGFVIQGGDPLGNGTGGNNMNVDPKFPGSSNVAGTVAMASSTTGQPMAYQSDAQFFVNLGDNAFLDGMGFIAFGEVTSGMDTIKTIENLETKVGTSGEKSTPVSPVTIKKAYVK